MLTSRRTFLATTAAAAVATSAAPLASAATATTTTAAKPVKRGHRIDALCYGDISADAVEHLLAGGMTAIGADLSMWPREYDNAVRELGRWAARFNDPELQLHCVREAADFDRAREAGKLGVVLTCQDATIIGNPNVDLDGVVSLFHQLGLRVLQLTHNQRTHYGDAFMEKRDGGLSRAGEELVQTMNQRRMIIDLSHCSRQTLFDTIAVSAQPPIVTHAGCRALANTARNKSDEEIRALGNAGGFFGIYHMTTWLTDGDTATIDTLLAHIRHAVDLIGPKQVGFGSDGDIEKLDAAAEVQRMGRVQKMHEGTPSAEWPVRHNRLAELNGPERMKRLADALSRHFDDETVDGIAGGNYVRYFQSVCG
ncbi:MAG TPA: membrane dipeptidase [Thermoanaerobaculia bacterium]|nr:membrane dipeptidase [Thermoanaerobaculia bacterium]